MKTTQQTSRQTARQDRRMQTSPKHIGQLPFHSRPELPNSFIKEAKRLHVLGVSITDIHRLLADPKSYMKAPGFKNSSINYYDVWCVLGYNKRALERATA